MSNLREMAFEEFNKRIDRAKYYEEKQDYQQALKEYASAIFQWYFGWESIERVPGGKYSDQEEKIGFLLTIGLLINSIAIDYYAVNQTRKASFFAKILK